jgi:hypothetical protein
VPGDNVGQGGFTVSWRTGEEQNLHSSISRGWQERDDLHVLWVFPAGQSSSHQTLIVAVKGGLLTGIFSRSSIRLFFPCTTRLKTHLSHSFSQFMTSRCTRCDNQLQSGQDKPRVRLTSSPRRSENFFGRYLSTHIVVDDGPAIAPFIRRCSVSNRC